MAAEEPIPTARTLIEVPKVVQWPPRPKVKAHPSHREWDVELVAAVPGQLAMFVRVNVALAESFTIGLRYVVPGERPCVLLRVNGDHGRHVNRHDGGVIAAGPHLHAPHPTELDVPPGPERPAEHAVALPPAVRTLAAAWPVFRASANVTEDLRVDGMMSRLHAMGAQLALFE